MCSKPPAVSKWVSISVGRPKGILSFETDPTGSSFLTLHLKSSVQRHRAALPSLLWLIRPLVYHGRSEEVRTTVQQSSRQEAKITNNLNQLSGFPNCLLNTYSEPSRKTGCRHNCTYRRKLLEHGYLSLLDTWVTFGSLPTSSKRFWFVFPMYLVGS